MEHKIRLTPGRILYATLFVLVLPILLILWASQTEAIISLPAIHHSLTGMFLISLGTLMVLWGMFSLYRYGNGLPMNPYPPTKYVTREIYHYLPHPIYSGASFLTIGISLYAGSIRGLWLISPLFILGCVALVMGFEKEDLKKRFPEGYFQPLISLPQLSEDSPTAWNKLSAYFLAVLPSLILFRFIFLLGEPSAPVISYMPFEIAIPVLSFTVIFYMLTYPLFVIAPLFAKTRSDLREFMTTGLIAAAFGFFAMIISPLITPLKTFADPDFWNKIIAFSASTSASYVAFPAFPVIWIWISITVFFRRFPSLKFFWYFLAILITVSCITTGMYSLIDVSAGLIVYWFARKRAAVWRFIQRSAETIANSWKEWDFGRIRIMNHGLYGGLATFSGIFLVGSLIGKEHLPAILMVAVMAMIVSALWAQFIEGSKRLLRPLGFYGGILGVVLGCLLSVLIFKEDFFLIWAPFAVAAPWIQGIGRVRCLVQGCCHGRITTPVTGIRYFHARSRVTRLANLKGEYLHPTPVYSILANIFSGIFLLKLWFASASLPLIIGLCFILNGLSRFVEESYRGEPQTPIIKGLRLYQWIALSGILIGAVLTAIPYPVNNLNIQFSREMLLAAIAGALLATFLTGIDFPLSNKRFSRLV